jgi:hypothetical protein
MVEMIRTAVDLEMRTNQSHLGLILDYRAGSLSLANNLRYVTRWHRFEDWKFGAEAIPATAEDERGNDITSWMV